MSLSPLSVTLASFADVPALVELLDILFSIEQDFHPDAEKQRRGLEMLLTRPEHGCIVVARHPDAGIVGMVSAQLVVSTASGAYSAWIEDVVLRPEWRTQGLGCRLLDAARDWAVARGARRLQLLADADNAPALGFYQHLGWQATRMLAWRKFP
jgi:GNAT superfamily N-acetyltransferase